MNAPPAEPRVLHILAPRTKKPLEDAKGVYHVTQHRQNSWAFPWRFIALTATLIYRVFTDHAQILHVHTHLPVITWAAWLASRFLNKPLITTCHPLPLRLDKGIRALYHSVSARGDRVIIPSQSRLQQVVLRYQNKSWFSKKKIRVIPPCIDLTAQRLKCSEEALKDLRHTLHISDETPVILWPKALKRNDGHEPLIKAVASMDSHPVIIAFGEQPSTIEGVKIIPPSIERDLVYGLAHIVVIPPKYSHLIGEAGLRGILLIAPDSPDARILIQPKQNSFLLPHWNSRALISNVKAALSLHGIAREMIIEHTWRRITQVASPQAHQSHLRRLYAEILSERREG